MNTINFTLLLSFLFVLPSFGQISQEHPELCAKPDGSVPLPPKSLPGVVDEVDEVCPLPDGRYVLFGSTYNATNINIIDSTHGVLLDSFDGFDPVMSPNQRWLVYRKFYPRHTELPTSEEYLLYDLTKTPAQNRPSDATLDERADVGAAIFPLISTGSSPFDNIGLPENQQHSFRSESFSWAPDSQAIAFGDSVQGKLSLVLVRLNSIGNATASVHPVPRAEVCARQMNAGEPVTLFLERPVLWIEEAGERLIRITLTSTDSVCAAKTLEIRSADFQSAKPEVHVEPKRKGTIVDQ